MNKKEALLLEQLYYSLLAKIDAGHEEKDIGTTRDTWLELRLNGESARIDLSKDKRDG